MRPTTSTCSNTESSSRRKNHLHGRPVQNVNYFAAYFHNSNKHKQRTKRKKRGRSPLSGGRPSHKLPFPLQAFDVRAASFQEVPQTKGPVSRHRQRHPSRWVNAARPCNRYRGAEMAEEPNHPLITTVKRDNTGLSCNDVTIKKTPKISTQ